MKIALLGDIGLFGRNTVRSNWKERFSELKDALSGYDYVIANLETPLTNSDRHIYGKSACIKGNPEDVEILKYLDVSHVSLANNHMYDYKKRGLDDTIRCLEINNIEWYGVGGKEVRLSNGNSTVNVYGFCCHSTFGRYLGSDANTINELNPELINEILEENQKKGEVTILSMHWGQEHVHYPNLNHVNLARKLCSGREGVIIHGHHPHVIQGIENVEGNIIAYSLGNFCFDDVYTNKSTKPLVKMTDDNNESFILSLDIQDNHVVSYDTVAYRLSNGIYMLDVGVDKHIEERSGLLNIPQEQYDSIRNDWLDSYYENRRSQRDLQWYLKRLNIDSALQILGNKKNKKQYKKLVVDFLKRSSSGSE